MRIKVLCAVVAIAAAGCGGSGSREAARSSQLPGDCAAIAGLDLPDTTFTATSVPAGAVVGGESVPEHCLLQGAMSPRTGTDGNTYQISFDVRMPRQWNGRFLFGGGGGNDGVVRPAIGPVTGHPSALSRGFVVATTDAGHQAGGNQYLLEPQGRIDHAYASYPRVIEAAKQLIVRAYGREAQWSYAMGGSGGGRQSMLLAQRYPDMVDGIVAVAPAMANPREPNVAAVYTVQAYQAAEPLTQQDVALLANAILQTCDALDGAADGMVFAPPSRCRFDPAVLACQGAKTPACLTAAQADAIRKDFGGARDPRGNAIYPRFPWDPGIVNANWRGWKLGMSILAVNIGYQFTPPEPSFDVLTFDYDRDVPKLAQQALAMQTTTANVDRFVERGGKMVLVHGMADGAFTAIDTIDYLNRLQERYGEAQVQAFARLYLVPGMNHTSGGPATDAYDALGAVVDWAENGTAPTYLIGRAGAGTPWPGRTRPLCPYPQYARYSGNGSLEAAQSFACTAD